MPKLALPPWHSRPSCAGLPTGLVVAHWSQGTAAPGHPAGQVAVRLGRPLSARPAGRDRAGVPGVLRRRVGHAPGLGEFGLLLAKASSPAYALVDPEGSTQAQRELAGIVAGVGKLTTFYLMINPRAAVEAHKRFWLGLLGWDTLRTGNLPRWGGQLTPDAIAAAASGGGVTAAASRLRRGGRRRYCGARRWRPGPGSQPTSRTWRGRRAEFLSGSNGG